MKTKLLIEQHFHGAFGIDFNKASVDDVLFLSKEILKCGIGGIFPTIVTDTIENTKRQIGIIKKAAEKQAKYGAQEKMSKIFGVHLEGIFLNPTKKGIHNPKHFLAPTIENYKLIEDDFIKIQTLAPELCCTPRPLREREEFQLEQNAKVRNSGEGSPLDQSLQASNLNNPENNLISYLNSKGIKTQAGHCVGGDLSGCTGATHLFNAMSEISHRSKSTVLSALIDDNIYTEIIADGVHVSDEALRLTFKAKPANKIILISDCLPIAKSDLKEMTFADEKITFDGEKATSKEGTLAGSTKLLPEIIKRLGKLGLFNPQFIENPYDYHGINLDGSVEWDEEFNITKVVF